MGVLLYGTFVHTFWVSSLICFLIDYFLTDLRVNGHRLTQALVLSDYYKMLPLVASNIVSAYPFFYAVEDIMLSRHVPNTWPLLVNLLAWLVTTDVLFYTIHRAFHSKHLYFIHAVHHEFKYTYGMGAIYAHPIEFYMANLVPVAVPLVVFRIPLRVCDFIVLFATLYTIIVSHGGFKLKLASGHLYHHLKYKYNFGLFKTDKVLGTRYMALE